MKVGYRLAVGLRWILFISGICCLLFLLWNKLCLNQCRLSSHCRLWDYRWMSFIVLLSAEGLRWISFIVPLLAVRLVGWMSFIVLHAVRCGSEVNVVYRPIVGCGTKVNVFHSSAVLCGSKVNVIYNPLCIVNLVSGECNLSFHYSLWI